MRVRIFGNRFAILHCSARDGRTPERGKQRQVFPHVRRSVALKHNRPRIFTTRFVRLRPDFGEILFTHAVVQPDGLEWTVALDGTGGVVIDAFAGTREQARRGVVLIHDEVGIGLVALERDADDHLADGRARQSVSTAERLRTEDDVNAERAALPHDAIQQDRGVLRNAVFFREEFLKLVNHQKDTRHRFASRLRSGGRRQRPFVTGKVLRADFAEQITTPAQFIVHALKHAQAERAVAFDGHNFRVRQVMAGVTLELDALLKIHQIEFHLFRTAPQREIRDDDVKQGGFAGTGLARDQRVLARVAADGEILQFGRARTPDGHAQFPARFIGPEISLGRRDLFKRNFHAIGVFSRVADPMQKLRGEFRCRRKIQDHAGSRFAPASQFKFFVFARQANAVAAQFIGNKILRHGVALVPLDEREHAATRAVRGDVAQALRRRLTEIHRERGDDDEMIFLRDGAGLGVVFRDGGIFVAQIHLDDFLHVLVQFRELLLELRRLRPDAAVDGARLVIGQMHERREVLSQPDRVENGELQPARRRGGEQT